MRRRKTLNIREFVEAIKPRLITRFNADPETLIVNIEKALTYGTPIDTTLTVEYEDDTTYATVELKVAMPSVKDKLK